MKFGGDDEMLERTKDNSLARRVAVTGLGKPATIFQTAVLKCDKLQIIIIINLILFEIILLYRQRVSDIPDKLT